jgi:hypothetical protein
MDNVTGRCEVPLLLFYMGLLIQYNSATKGIALELQGSRVKTRLRKSLLSGDNF